MNLRENIKEGIKSIKANKLRTILTALLISIGITSLVGILTAVDGIQNSIDKSFSSLGANTFDIEDHRPSRGSSGGKKQKTRSKVVGIQKTQSNLGKTEPNIEQGGNQDKENNGKHPTG